MGIDFTVFTPTYNRGYTLSRSYEALKNQTNKEFVWLIVDDGSVDNTRALVTQWTSECMVNIQYIYQENAGKQRAVNTGIKNCKTEFFGFLDSDDCYLPTTVENFKKNFSAIQGMKNVAGILARRGTPDGETIGSTNLPKESFIMNFDTLYKKYHFYGDTCRAYYTNILRRFIYPEIEDKFILESVMLSAIDYEYDLLIVNAVYSICEYLNDGYTKNEHRLYHRNPLGYALGISQITISRRGILRQAKYTAMYAIWCRVKKLEKPYKWVKNKCMYIFVYPLSYLCYLLKWPKWMFYDA